MLSATSVAAGGNTLYVAGGPIVDAGVTPNLYTCDPLGCTVGSTLVASGVGTGGYGYVVDASGAYWTDATNTTILTSAATLARAPNIVQAIATDNTAVYWGDNVGGVYKVAK
jgi:hypothetical protein